MPVLSGALYLASRGTGRKQNDSSTGKRVVQRTYVQQATPHHEDNGEENSGEGLFWVRQLGSSQIPSCCVYKSPKRGESNKSDRGISMLKVTEAWNSRQPIWDTAVKCAFGVLGDEDSAGYSKYGSRTSSRATICELQRNALPWPTEEEPVEIGPSKLFLISSPIDSYAH